MDPYSQWILQLFQPLWPLNDPYGSLESMADPMTTPSRRIRSGGGFPVGSAEPRLADAHPPGRAPRTLGGVGFHQR